MSFNFAGKIRVGYLTAFTLLLLSYLLSFYTNWQLSRETKWVNHTNQMIHNLESLSSGVKDAETGVRGYMVMKDQHFLDSYYPSRQKVDSSYSRLLKYSSDDTVDNNLQVERLTYLRQLINEKYRILNQLLIDFKETNMTMTDSMKIQAYRGKEIMDSMRNTIGLLQQREDDNMRKRTEKVKASSTAIKVITLSSLLIAILVAFYSLVSFNEENKAKEEAARKAEGYRFRLEERVAELKKVNQEITGLRSMEKFATTGRLARTIAHEIRNPLTNIGLAADQLKGEIPSSEDSAMLLDMINRNGLRINQLITDLLSSTKFSELQQGSISINEMLDSALELAKDRIQLKKIQVQKNYASDMCNVSADMEKLKIAFLNVIVNAVEAMQEEKGLLKLKTESKDNKCVITITDNGMGMDSETQSKLFEPYFTSKAKGNGLGLTNTQNIILNHKGNIEVESQPGKGTSFIISLDFPDK